MSLHWHPHPFLQRGARSRSSYARAASLLRNATTAVCRFAAIKIEEKDISTLLTSGLLRLARNDRFFIIHIHLRILALTALRGCAQQKDESRYYQYPAAPWMGCGCRSPSPCCLDRPFTAVRGTRQPHGGGSCTPGGYFPHQMRDFQQFKMNTFFNQAPQFFNLSLILLLDLPLVIGYFYGVKIDIIMRP
jgi:hypothetical protein